MLLSLQLCHYVIVKNVKEQRALAFTRIRGKYTLFFISLRPICAIILFFICVAFIVGIHGLVEIILVTLDFFFVWEGSPASQETVSC